MFKSVLKRLGVEPKVSADTAGYMELEGAKKDAGCHIVNVIGGVSTQLGCCNLFKHVRPPKQFRCGTCKFVAK